MDLYNDWIEACLAANRKAEKERAERRKLQATAGSAGPRAPVRAGMAAAPVRSTGGIALKAIRRPREDDDDDDLPELPDSVSGGRNKRTAMDYAGVGSDDDD